MKKLLAILAVVAVVVAALVLTRRGSDTSPRPATPVAVAPAANDAASAGVPAHVKRIEPDERRELEQRIDAARVARGNAAIRAGERPQLPTRTAGSLSDLPPGALAMLNEALPFLDACYNHGSKNYGPNLAIALVTLHGDPDVGTLVDAAEILDDKGAPIDREIADCLASTLRSLQLPPIDTTTDIDVQLSFRF